MRPIPLFWLECFESDLPNDETWLAPAELASIRDTWVPKRRRDWVLGRWTAKCAVATHLKFASHHENFRRISVVPDESGAPRLWISPPSTGIALSISHRDGRALAVICPEALSVGCDLEKVEPRSPAFVEQMFTPSEIEQVERRNRAGWTGIETLIWSVKESVLKSMGVGLRVDTRMVSVAIEPGFDSVTGWHPFSAKVADESSFAGWWCRECEWIRTIAASEHATSPVRLSPLAIPIPRVGYMSRVS